MNEVILPPSPNSNKRSILACADDGTVCWGAKNIIVVAKPDKEYGSMNYFFIHEADTKIVTTLAFLPISKDGILHLVSGGDNVLRIWNLNNFTKEQENRELDESDRVVAVDCFKQNAHLIACVSKSQYLIIWNILLNSTKLINLGEVRATCLSCCPHDSYIVSIGTKCGLIYVVDIQGSGTIKYRLNMHLLEINSLSWCPVPVNVFEKKNTIKEYLLASGSKDRKITIWRAGTDGKCQFQWLAFKDHFTSFLWIKPTILLSSMPCGGLVSWEFSADFQCRTKRHYLGESPIF